MKHIQIRIRMLTRQEITDFMKQCYDDVGVVHFGHNSVATAMIAVKIAEIRLGQYFSSTADPATKIRQLLNQK